jgi:hypothetical protein
MKTKIITICSLILLATGMGCVALSHYVTPANINEGAVKYVVDAGIADANNYKGFPNLAKAVKLKTDTDAAHSVIQLDLQQKVQKDNLEYAIHNEVVMANVVSGKETEEMLFGEKGLLSLGLSLAGFGTLTGLVGLMRKRPGDITKEEKEQAISQAIGKSVDELTEKQKQFIQVVHGVQLFIDKYKNEDGEWSSAVYALKDIFDRTQDTPTQIAVATAKKTL